MAKKTKAAWVWREDVYSSEKELLAEWDGSVETSVLVKGIAWRRRGWLV